MLVAPRFHRAKVYGAKEKRASEAHRYGKASEGSAATKRAIPVPLGAGIGNRMDDWHARLVFHRLQNPAMVGDDARRFAASVTEASYLKTPS